MKDVIKCANCTKGEFTITHNDGIKQCDVCGCVDADYFYKVN